jgi:HSP20 family protein
MTLVRWSSPVSSRDLVGMQEEMSRLIDSVFNRGTLRETAYAFTPVVDVEETPEEFVIRADLPGVSQKDVHVNLMGDTITLRGERKQDNTREDGGYVRVERSHGQFERSFTLSSPVRADQVKATYRDGVLEIHVPKAEEAKTREIPVHVG